jgi:hypothetical protein
MTLKLGDVGIAPDERIAHQIRVADNERQVDDILVGQSRQPERAVGKD